jgi:hypothetical protein
MIKNIGTIDKAIRITLAAVLLGLILAKMVASVGALVIGALAVILLATSLISFCPLYWPLKLSTRKAQNK